jgi:hypothetical protein
MKPFKLILASLVTGLAVFAQGPGAPPPGEGRPPMMRYDASKEVTLQGTVSAVNIDTRGPGPFVTLTFVSAGTTCEVLAGPEFLVKQSRISFAKDDVLTIVGVSMDGPRGTAFVARQITKGDIVLTLLDQDGRPAAGPQGS